MPFGCNARGWWGTKHPGWRVRILLNKPIKQLQQVVVQKRDWSSLLLFYLFIYFYLNQNALLYRGKKFFPPAVRSDSTRLQNHIQAPWMIFQKVPSINSCAAQLSKSQCLRSPLQAIWMRLLFFQFTILSPVIRNLLLHSCRGFSRGI